MHNCDNQAHAHLIIDHFIYVSSYLFLSHIWAADRTSDVGTYGILPGRNLRITWADVHTSVDRRRSLATPSNLLRHNGKVIVLMKQVKTKVHTRRRKDVPRFFPKNVIKSRF